MSRNENVSLTENLKRFFNQIPPAITILVVGKTGVGKSALVNALIGEEVAKEGAGPESCTTKVEKYQGNIECQGRKNIQITIWDSPGYEDVEEEDDYFTQMKTVKENSDVDLLLFCTPLNERRWRKEDAQAMKAVNQVFGQSIWKQSMIALTQANLIQDSNGQVTKAAYDEKLSQWKAKIDTVLKDLGVQTEVAAVPTGSLKFKSLPNTDDWFSEFWTKAFCSMRPNKRVAFWRMNELRIQFSSVPADTSSRRRAEFSTAFEVQPKFDSPEFGTVRGRRAPSERSRGSGRPAALADTSGYRPESGDNIYSPPVILTTNQREEVQKGFWESFMDFVGKAVPFVTFVTGITSSGIAGFVSGIGRSVVSFFSNLFG